MMTPFPTRVREAVAGGGPAPSAGRPPRGRAIACGLAGVAIAATLLVAPAFAREAPASFASLVKDVAPAVVNVSTTQRVEGGPMMDLPFQDLPENSPFRDFFKHFFNGPMGQGRPMEQHSLGSGFLIDPSGYVVTNNHVVGTATQISVTLNDGKTYKAKLIGRDARTDLALLKIADDHSFPYVQWGDSDKAEVGDWVIAVGNPFGLGGTVTAGIISARGRDLHEGPYDSFLQTDAAINRGNSGGPMFNMDGRVIGINSAIYSPNGGSVGIGFAVPSSLARPVVEQLRDHGKVERGWLGVQIQQVTPDVADSLGLKAAVGALVTNVTADSPAQKAGLRQGDVILRYDGKDIKDLRDLTRAVADTKPGTRVSLTVWRDGREASLQVESGKAPEMVTSENEEQAPAVSPSAGETKVPAVGLTLGRLTNDARQELGLKKDVKGALITDVEDGKPAADRDIRPGDVIVKVGDQAVTSPGEAAQKVEQAQKANQRAVLLLLNRRGEERFVALPFARASG